MNAELDFYSGAGVGFEIGNHDRVAFRRGFNAFSIAASNALFESADTHLPESLFNRRDIPPAGFLGLVGLGRRLRFVSSLMAVTRVRDATRAGRTLLTWQQHLRRGRAGPWI